MIRYYGERPYTVAVLHGGPGACGSVRPIAEELSSSFGVIEPFQSAATVRETVDELSLQLDEAGCKEPVALVGHSWGAWLALLFAAAYPKRTRSVVLVGCAPLDARYVPEIARRRMKNLSPEERARFAEVTHTLERPNAGEKDALLSELGKLAEKADSYALSEAAATNPASAPDGEAYARLWPEAEKLRASGELLRAAARVSCPLFVLHGETDPHPAEGVNDPLIRAGVPFTYYRLQECGHAPYLEKSAPQFYGLLKRILEEKCAR